MVGWCEGSHGGFEFSSINGHDCGGDRVGRLMVADSMAEVEVSFVATAVTIPVPEPVPVAED